MPEWVYVPYVPNLDPILSPEQVPGFSLGKSEAQRWVHVGHPPGGPWEWEDRGIREFWVRTSDEGQTSYVDLRLTRCADREAVLEAIIGDFGLWTMMPRPGSYTGPLIGDYCWSSPWDRSSTLVVAAGTNAINLSVSGEGYHAWCETLAMAIIARLETWRPSPPPPLNLEVRVLAPVARPWNFGTDGLAQAEVRCGAYPVALHAEVRSQGRLLWEDEKWSAPCLFAWDGRFDQGDISDAAKPGPYEMVVTATDPYGHSARQRIMVEVSWAR